MHSDTYYNDKEIRHRCGTYTVLLVGFINGEPYYNGFRANDPCRLWFEPVTKTELERKLAVREISFA